MAVNVNNNMNSKPIVGRQEMINIIVVIISIFMYKLNFSFFQTLAIAKMNKGLAIDETNRKEANITNIIGTVNFVNSNRIKVGNNKRIRAKPIPKLVTMLIEAKLDNFLIKSGAIWLKNKATANI